MNFREYLHLIETNTVGTHNDGPGGTFVSTSVSGSENPNSSMTGHPLHLPGIDLGLPTVTRTSVIRFIERNKNPIHILLKDGTRLLFTWDQYKRITGPEPKVGKIMSVVFQRFPGDKGDTPSKIQSVHCH